MDKQLQVVVLGDSLLMDSVGTILRNRVAPNVIRVDASGIDIGARLVSLQPELIVFELDVPHPCALLSLLQEQTGALFLGIDRHSSQVLVLNSSCHLVDNMAELCALARTELEWKAYVGKGGSESDRMRNHRLPE